MTDKLQQNLEIMAKMMETLDSKSNVEEVLKMVAEMVALIKQAKERNEEVFKNLQETFAMAQKDLKDSNKEQFDTLKARLQANIQDSISKLKGKDGYTPVKGVDYFDGKDADETKIVQAVLAQIPQMEIVDDKALGSNKEEVLAKYPFTEYVVEVLSKIKVVEKPDTASYVGEFVEKTGRDLIVVRDKKSTTLFHEMIHAYIANSNFFSGIKYSFQVAFDQELKSNATLQLINKVLEDKVNYPDQSTLTEERYAYVGEAYGAGGLQNLPESLKGFYEEILVNTEVKKNDIMDMQESIKSIFEDVKELKARSTSRGGGGGRAGGMQLTDLSSSTDGSTKTFSVPKNTLGFVIGSDFPTVLMEGNGFSVNASRTQITLTTLNAPSQGSQLLFVGKSFFNI